MIHDLDVHYVHRSAVRMLLIVFVVVSCATTPSPSPQLSATTSASVSLNASPTPSPVLARTSNPTVSAPTPTPAPSVAAIPTPFTGGAGWPLTAGGVSEPVFGPDGTAYVVVGGSNEQGDYLVALDTAGYVKPGWPIEVPAGSKFQWPAAVGPDGSVYVDVCGGPEVGCALRRLDAMGREMPDWPFQPPRDFACPSGGAPCYSLLKIGSNGTAYLTAWREAGGQQVMAVDASGKVMPGWPVVPDADDGWWSNAQVGSDGTLFILGVPDGRETPALLAAYAPDGSLRDGWPVAVPDLSDYLLGPQGTVVVWSLIDNTGELCLEPRRTVFTVLGPDGRTLPGWPRGSKGFASRPSVDADDTVYYVSAQGNVYAHDRAGEIKAGWPVAVPAALNSGCNPEGLYLAPDGTIYILAHDHVTGSEITARSPDGRSKLGWPYRPAGDLVGPCFDTECNYHTYAPAFGPDGTTYLLVFHADAAEAWAEVAAVDPKGQLKPGWPYRLPMDPTAVQIEALTVSPDGRLFVRGDGYNTDSFLFALDPDGRLSK